MEKKKVILLLQDFSNGGVQKVMINLAQGLSEQGIEVKYVVARKRGELLPQIGEEKILSCDLERGHGDILPILSMKRTYKILNEYYPDVVIASPGMFTAVNVIYKYLFKGHIKCINLVDNRISLLKKGKIKHKISFILYKILYPYADYIVAAHRNAEKDLLKEIKKKKCKIKCIYHPLINKTEVVKPNVQKPNEETLKLVAIGRLVPEKDFETLIKAVKILSIKKDLKLEILGEGPEREKLQQLIEKENMEDKVEMIGYVKNPFSYLVKSDVFILSSQQEAFGNVIVEALYAGKYIVATDCSSGGPREILLSGRLGTLCECKNPEALAKAIEKEIQRNIDYDARKKRVEDFEITQVANQYREIINE